MSDTNTGATWMGRTHVVSHDDGIFHISVRFGDVYHHRLISDEEASAARIADFEFQEDAPLEDRARFLACWKVDHPPYASLGSP